jgi:hypothetical protein
MHWQLALILPTDLSGGADNYRFCCAPRTPPTECIRTPRSPWSCSCMRAPIRPASLRSRGAPCVHLRSAATQASSTRPAEMRTSVTAWPALWGDSVFRLLRTTSQFISAGLRRYFSRNRRNYPKNWHRGWSCASAAARVRLCKALSHFKYTSGCAKRCSCSSMWANAAFGRRDHVSTFLWRVW